MNIEQNNLLNNKFNNLIKDIKGKSYFDIHLYNDLYQSKKQVS